MGRHACLSKERAFPWRHDAAQHLTAAAGRFLLDVLYVQREHPLNIKAGIFFPHAKSRNGNLPNASPFDIHRLINLLQHFPGMGISLWAHNTAIGILDAGLPRRSLTAQPKKTNKQ